VSVRIHIEDGPHEGISRGEIARRARAMMGCLQLNEAELSIVLTGDSQIQELNRVYRRKDRPTDVLAFAMREGDFARVAGGLLGDVIVSVPTARKQALLRKRLVLEEVTMLLAHGLLHLLGWDHDTAAKDKRMRAETERLCEAARPSRPPVSGNAAAPKTPRRRQRKQGDRV